jgi:hypothetical protein
VAHSTKVDAEIVVVVVVVAVMLVIRFLPVSVCSSARAFAGVWAVVPAASCEVASPLAVGVGFVAEGGGCGGCPGLEVHV